MSSWDWTEEETDEDSDRIGARSSAPALQRIIRQRRSRRTKTVTLVGTVKEFRWQNPHTWIEVMVPNEKGQEVLWAVELTSPTYLVRAGGSPRRSSRATR